MPTLEQHQQAYHNAMQAGDREAAALIMQDIFKAEKANALKGAAEEGSTYQRAMANLGAGTDSLLQGLRQILPGKGPSDADIHAKRERDQALADATDTGSGPEWAPTLGKTLQFVGETAPTVVLPGVGAAGNLAVKTAGKVLPRATEATLGMLRAAGTGAAGGGVAGALQPVTEDESRGLNTVLGMAGGAVLPAAGAAWQAVKRGISNVTRAGGTARAGSVLREALGADADTIASQAAQRERARQFQPGSVRDIPESLAEATGSARAARVESAARRGETADTWDDFVREQNARRYMAVEDATREGSRLDSRVASRDRATDPLREKALGQAGKDPWFAVPASQAAERVAASPAAANPAVQRVADYVRGQLGTEAKTAITPERLYEVRKVLADKLNGPHVIGDDLSAATKGARRQTMELINGIDDALNQASGGKWQAYLDRYQAKSAPVNASRAAADARGVFTDTTIPEIGGAPEVTLNRLRAARTAGQSNFDPRATDFSPRADRTLQAIEDQYVRAQEPVKVRKLVGTQGGGSQTSTDVDAALSQLVKRSNIPIISAVVEHMTHGSNVAARAELSRLLQNPSQAAAAIRLAGQRGQPLSEAQRLLLEATTRAAAVGTAGALTEQ